MHIKFNTATAMAMLLVSQVSFSNDTGQDQTPEDVHWAECVQSLTPTDSQPKEKPGHHKPTPDGAQLLSQCQPPEPLKQKSD